MCKLLTVSGRVFPGSGNWIKDSGGDSGNVNRIQDMPHFEHGCGIRKKAILGINSLPGRMTVEVRDAGFP